MRALCHESCIQNDVRQLTSLSTFTFTFTIWFGIRDTRIDSPYLCTVLSASCTHVQQNFKNSQNNVSILPTLHPHPPK
jgi:hypothetical protein